MMSDGYFKPSNKRLIFSLVGIFAAIGIFTSAMVMQTNEGVSNDISQHELLERGEVNPSEVRMRTGIPILVSFEGYDNSVDHFPIDEGQYDYLDRAVQQGATLISDKEMEEYFREFSSGGFKFAVTFKDGTSGSYTINYFEPPISLERHNVLISILDEQIKELSDRYISIRGLSSNERADLLEAIEDPYTWRPIEENAASRLNELITENGHIFNTEIEGDYRTIRIMYLGPYSEELSRPEFQAMYGEIGKESVVR